METGTREVQRLNDRSLGWLRFMWDKATTPDDWSDQGEPHPWWDRYTEPPMCAFPRFDLAEMAYALPLMMESTPAWREAYVRILDELVARYVSFWGAIDWNTLIGPDPNVDRYPPQWLAVLPEDLRGRYAMPGWTANGVEPWGLQPDPVGCDGNLFYRGWLNLLLGIRHYVAGAPLEGESFEVYGYRNRRFTWTHERIADFISAQMDARPQGPHCENTKIWPFCVSAAGLGLRLHDSLFGGSLNEPFLRWIEFAKTHYTGRSRSGEVDWFALYYDPIEARAMVPPGPVSALSALAVLHYLYPQDPDFCVELYEMATSRLGWSDRSLPVSQLTEDPQMISIALWMARELGDDTTEERLREVTETEFEPRWFGAEDGCFAYWLGLGERWPRGQVNATMMMSECASPGAWSRIFREPATNLHSQPTVVGVDYPRLGIRRAVSDLERGVLEVETFAATASTQGEATSFGVERLPRDEISVTIDGSEHEGVRPLENGRVEIPLSVGVHRIQVAFGASA